MTASALHVGAIHVETALSLYRFAIVDERKLHAAIATILDDFGVRYEQEVRLFDELGKPVGRIDLLTEDGVGIEVKVKGSAVDVARQLRGYARSPRVTELLLATTVRRHATDIPPSAGRTPIRIAALGGGL